jgi:hypothetical protein
VVHAALRGDPKDVFLSGRLAEETVIPVLPDDGDDAVCPAGRRGANGNRVMSHGVVNGRLPYTLRGGPDDPRPNRDDLRQIYRQHRPMVERSIAWLIGPEGQLTAAAHGHIPTLTGG